LDSSWYNDIIFFLQNFQSPPELLKNKARFLKQKEIKFCLLNDSLYWKDPGGVLLKCITKFEAQQTMKEFHEGDCGGHHYWKITINKILRSSFCWPTIFVYVYKKVSSCHECHIFEGKRKLLPLPLKPIFVEAPFKQWGLDFIWEVQPSYST